jgi:hypothetical protein
MPMVSERGLESHSPHVSQSLHAPMSQLNPGAQSALLMHLVRHPMASQV